jgi:hypothetical protein
MVNSGYQLHAPDTPVDPNRPAYGGTCYSDFAIKTNYPVIAYDEEGGSSSQIFSASTSGAQAYAHPIDGWALTSPSIIGCPTPTPSPSPSNSEFSSSSSRSSQSDTSISPNSAIGSTATTEPKGLSTVAIAGAAIGGVVFLIAVVALVWFALSYRKKHRRPPPPPKVYHMADESCRYEADNNFTGTRNEKASQFHTPQLNNGHGAFEMDAYTPAELDGGGAGSKRNSKGLSSILDGTDQARITRMVNWKQR